MRSVLPRSGVSPDSIAGWVSLSAQRTGLSGEGISSAAPVRVAAVAAAGAGEDRAPRARRAWP